MDVVHLDFSKIFVAVSHNILIVKLSKYGIDEWTVRWTENWLDGRAQRVVLSGAKSSWRPCSTYSSMTWMMEYSMPSASLWMTQTGENCLVHQKAVLPFRGTWAGWRAGQKGTP